LRYPVVLLDVGGTLIRPRGSFGEVYAEVFSEFGVRCDAERFNSAIYTTWDEMSRAIPSGADRYTHFEGGENGYWRRFIQRAVELATGELVGDRLANAGLKKLQERFGSVDAWQVFDDALPALEALRQRGARLAVVSNWDSRLPDVLKTLSLDGWFETVVVSHFEGVEKPDAAIFRRALERIGAQATDAIHVGDSLELDGAGATAAGVDWVWVDRHNPDNDKAIPDLSHLPTIVENGL
jgi:putative hydrolase of the HAD superfamily